MTATEKYNSVLEGSMAKGEFLRQMKQAFPQYLTVSNGFDDSVSILKQKGMISENKLKDIRPVQNLADNFPLNTIERGVDYELEKAGIDPVGTVTKEQYVAAKQKCISNLQKDQAFYYNLAAGESANVDKHDKMKETKRGAKEADTFNAMKKATLKEGVEEADAIPTEPGVPGERASNHDRKMALRSIIDFLTINGHPDSGHKVSTQDALDFIRTHKDDIYSGDIDHNDIQDVWHNYDEYETINRDDVGEVMGIDRKGNKKPDTDGSDAAKFKRAAKGMEEEMDDATMDAIKNYEPGSMDERPHEYKPGDMFTTDFDYEGMLKAGLRVRVNTPVQTMQAIYDSFEDVNYHRENAHLGDVIDAIQAGNKEEATEALKKYRRAIKDTMSDIFEGAFPMRERDDSYVPRNGAVVSERVGGLQEFIALIQDRAAENDTSEREEAEEVMYAIGDHYNIGVDVIKGPWDDDDEADISEKKGKDLDKDGDVDGDDYKAAKDKAIKKAMGKDEIVKENLKAIIQKVLQEGTINEAATQELARIADTYAGFDGMKGAILDLQNLVSDIEAYYDKTRDKIQKVYDTLGEIRNEEGLKVGGFLAPAIESAFMKDLRPVTKQGFTKGLDAPKVRVISQKDIDQHNSGERPLGETEATPPKQTVYTPNI